MSWLSKQLKSIKKRAKSTLKSIARHAKEYGPALLAVIPGPWQIPAAAALAVQGVRAADRAEEQTQEFYDALAAPLSDALPGPVPIADPSPPELAPQPLEPPGATANAALVVPARDAACVPGAEAVSAARSAFGTAVAQHPAPELEAASSWPDVGTARAVAARFPAGCGQPAVDTASSGPGTIASAQAYAHAEPAAADAAGAVRADAQEAAKERQVRGRLLSRATDGNHFQTLEDT